MVPVLPEQQEENGGMSKDAGESHLQGVGGSACSPPLHYYDHNRDNDEDDQTADLRLL